MKIDEYDSVRAIVDLSGSVLKGTRGAVVFVYTKPKLGYEVEFFDDNFESLDVLTVYPNEIEKIDM